MGVGGLGGIVGGFGRGGLLGVVVDKVHAEEGVLVEGLEVEEGCEEEELRDERQAKETVFGRTLLHDRSSSRRDSGSSLHPIPVKLVLVEVSH